MKTRRMVKLRSAFYNAALLVPLFACVWGCGGKPATPPPGASGDSSLPAVDLGSDSASPVDGPAKSTPSPAGSNPGPAEEQGEK